jgi:aminotransferase
MPGLSRLSESLTLSKVVEGRRAADVLAARGVRIIDLGIGEPDFMTPPQIIHAGVESLGRGETHYTSSSGTIELRRALSSYLKQLYDVEYDPDAELLITVGVSEALYLALTAVIDPGDQVIVPQPCFVAYNPEVIFNGGVPVPVNTRMEDNFQVTAEQIQAKITPKTKRNGAIR